MKNNDLLAVVQEYQDALVNDLRASRKVEDAQIERAKTRKALEIARGNMRSFEEDLRVYRMPSLPPLREGVERVVIQA